MNVEKKAKKRSLSLSRSSEKYKTPKKVDHQSGGLQSQLNNEEVICLSSSSEDILTPPVKISHSDHSVVKDSDDLSLSQEKSHEKKNNVKKNLDSPSTSGGSTITYSLSPRTSQQTPRTPSKTPSTPKSGNKFFSPTKKRAVTSKNSAKRNLNMQFKENNQQNGTKDETSQPKYQDDKTLNLLNIIEKYLNCDELKRLLKEDSQEMLSNFTFLEEPSMRVVCRLFWRQPGWYREEQIEDIASGKKQISNLNKHEIIKSLVDNRWIISAQSQDDSNMGFDDYVKLLKKPELSEICKDLKLKIQSKQDAVDALRKFCQCTAISNFFTGKMGNNTSRVLKMLKIKTGHCYKLSNVARSTLYELYVLMYMGMNYSIIREKRLELILLHDKVKKETYPIDKHMVVDNASVVFSSRDEFYRYFESHQLYDKYMESTDTQEKCDIVLQAFKLYKEVAEEDMLRYKSLPPWLRRFTPANTYVKILESGVQELKKDKSEKKYTLAVQILDSLITQLDFRQHKKYKWYAEKALILHKHLDRTELAVRTLLEGFKANLSEEAKDVLRPRAKQIANQRNVVLSDELRQSLQQYVEQEFILESNLPADHVYKLPLDNHKQRGKLKFETHLEDGRTVLSAEEYCVVHYTHNGEFTHGEHWEGRIVNTIFFLLFWDIIYTKPEGIPGIFMSHYQRYPLDLYSGSFYSNRKAAIDERLQFIEESTDEEVLVMMQNRWEERPEYEVSEICRSMGWAAVAAVARCLGARALAAVCRRLASDYSYTHSGFPDLTLWNVHTKQIKFVEVKTDSDKPSMKQLQWMQYLIAHNIAAGFCYVGVNTTRSKARSRDNAPIL
ncbi:unnamed protein product [Arctia plantaginis]|uniref:Fanconi-associated nuclease n=1 Tax=Arctia plantaginis TaxID=874455 RepID=A0A8S0Z995_ARCPL|nr:unnamed protein product [Arctia plantaginis]